MRRTDEDGKIVVDCKNCRHSEKCAGCTDSCQYEAGLSPHYVMHLGKYRGKSLAEICKDDPQYLLWMTSNVAWFELSPSTRRMLVTCNDGYDKKLYDAEVRRESKFGDKSQKDEPQI